MALGNHQHNMLMDFSGHYWISLAVAARLMPVIASPFARKSI